MGCIFDQLIALSQITGLSNNTHFVLAGGLGTFGYEPKVDYLYGLPTGIQPGGVALDIPLNIVTASNDGDVENKKNFVIQTGVLSSTLEHAVPEQMFNDPDNPVDAISSVKALQIAAAEGQRIYQITQANIDTVLPLLNLSSGSEAEIVASVNAGLEVITHTEQVSVPGYTGEGFVIIDPQTGSGAYKIGGGGNGGYHDVDGILDAVMNGFLAISEKLENELLSLLKYIKTGVDHALVVLDLLLNCSLKDLIVALPAYVWFAALATLVGLMLTAFIGGLLGVFVGVMVSTMMLGYMAEKIALRCRQ